MCYGVSSAWFKCTMPRTVQCFGCRSLGMRQQSDSSLVSDVKPLYTQIECQISFQSKSIASLASEPWEMSCTPRSQRFSSGLGKLHMHVFSTIELLLVWQPAVLISGLRLAKKGQLQRLLWSVLKSSDLRYLQNFGSVANLRLVHHHGAFSPSASSYCVT